MRHVVFRQNGFSSLEKCATLSIVNVLSDRQQLEGRTANLSTQAHNIHWSPVGNSDTVNCEKRNEAVGRARGINALAALPAAIPWRALVSPHIALASCTGLRLQQHAKNKQGNLPKPSLHQKRTLPFPPAEIRRNCLSATSSCPICYSNCTGRWALPLLSIQSVQGAGGSGA